MNVILFWFRLSTIWSFEQIEKLIKHFDFRKDHSYRIYSMLCDKVDEYVRDNISDADDILILLNCIPKGDDNDGYSIYKKHLESSLGLRLEYLLKCELCLVVDYAECIERIQYIALRTSGYSVCHRYLIHGLDSLTALSKKSYAEVAVDIERSNEFNIDNESFWRELKARIEQPHPQYTGFYAH